MVSFFENFSTDSEIDMDTESEIEKEKKVENEKEKEEETGQEVYTNVFEATVILHKDGSVTCSGAKTYGGDPGVPEGDLKNIKKIVKTDGAFAALRSDGKVIVWGSSMFGGDPGDKKHQLRNIQTIVSTRHAFAALRKSGKIVMWGNDGDSDEIMNVLNETPEFKGFKIETKPVLKTTYKNIFNSVAELYSNKTVRCSGNKKYGGDPGPKERLLVNVESIAQSDGAFAALRSDQTVVVWGDSFFGGDPGKKQRELVDIEYIVGDGSAFAARREDGKTILWGADADYDALSRKLSKIIKSGAPPLKRAKTVPVRGSIGSSSENVMEKKEEETRRRSRRRKRRSAKEGSFSMDVTPRRSKKASKPVRVIKYAVLLCTDPERLHQGVALHEAWGPEYADYDILNPAGEEIDEITPPRLATLAEVQNIAKTLLRKIREDELLYHPHYKVRHGMAVYLQADAYDQELLIENEVCSLNEFIWTFGTAKDAPFARKRCAVELQLDLKQVQDQPKCRLPKVIGGTHVFYCSNHGGDPKRRSTFYAETLKILKDEKAFFRTAMEINASVRSRKGGGKVVNLLNTNDRYLGGVEYDESVSSALM